MGFKYLKDVVTLELNIEKCVGCGLCKIVCPHRVFQLKDNRAVIEDKESCMECGACASNCPVKAIKVDSGVGCAAAIMNNMMGKKGKCC